LQRKALPALPAFLKATNEAMGDKISILKAPIEKDACSNLAGKYKVTRTPTVIYFAKGKEKKRVPIAGKSWNDIQKYLARLAGKTCACIAQSTFRQKASDETSHRQPELTHAGSQTTLCS